MTRNSFVAWPAMVLVAVLFCSAGWADSLSGLPDAVVVNDELVSLTYDGTEYVVANGDLVLGQTTRWYIDPSTQQEIHWVDGDPAPAATVSGTSDPKVGDTGAKGDNWLFRVGSSNDISSIDGIDFQVTIFPFPTSTIFVFERGGNDTGTFQGILADGTLRDPVAFSPGSAYADTGVNVGGQNAFGVVFKTDVPVIGVRITASGHDTLTICTPRGDDPKGAHEPSPEVGATGVPTSVTLSWRTGVDPADANVPNPAITKHHLWLSVGYDPANPPAWPDWNAQGVQIIQIPVDVIPADGNVDETASRQVTLQLDKLYYWIVDESLGAAHVRDWDNIVQGNVWYFETQGSGPVVDAGSSIVAWLENGTAIVDVNATVTDATNNVTGMQWSVLAKPFGATDPGISNPAAEDVTVTMDQAGRYVLELEAVDATLLRDSDMMEINVYNDRCEAAKNSPAGYTAPLYDFNNDCIVNFIDFAMFATEWLEDASLAEPFLYEPGQIFLPPVVEFTLPLEGAVISGAVTIRAIAYDPAVGMQDGAGIGPVFFEVMNSQGAVLATRTENTEAYEMPWDTTNGNFPNGVYRIRATATSDAGYVTIVEVSATVNNP